jgi:hypothetical protein
MPRDEWVPVTTALCVLRLRMEERHPIWRVSCERINSCEQPTVGGPPAWVLGEVLITSRRKYVSSYETFIRPLCCLPKMVLFINFFNCSCGTKSSTIQKNKETYQQSGLTLSRWMFAFSITFSHMRSIVVIYINCLKSAYLMGMESNNIACVTSNKWFWNTLYSILIRITTYEKHSLLYF